MELERYIVWSEKRLNLSAPWPRRWYIKQVLLRGGADGVATLNQEKIKDLFLRLDLPTEFRRLWEAHFAYEGS